MSEEGKISQFIGQSVGTTVNNNDPENLHLFNSNSEHVKFHRRFRRLVREFLIKEGVR